MIALKLVCLPEGDAVPPFNGVEGGAFSIRETKGDYRTGKSFGYQCVAMLVLAVEFNQPTYLI